MTVRTRLLLVATAAATVVSALVTTPASALPGPRLYTPRDLLERSIECSVGIDDAKATPVLLVHGTWTTPQESWSWSYGRVMPALGYPTCTVALPDHATGDIQRSLEYVVNAIRRIALRAKRRISVIGHSQGALLATFALRFWPDLASYVDDFIGLAGVYGPGSTHMDFDCHGRRCHPAVQQMRPDSRLLAAYRHRRLPAGPSYTSILTLADEIVTPQPRASTLAGARNIAIQDYCGYPRPIDHITILGDAVAYALVTDALAHAGPVDPARASRSNCLALPFPGADVAAGVAQAPTFIATLVLPSSLDTDHEPPLRCELDPACPKSRLRPALRSSTTPVQDGRRPWTFTTSGILELPEGALDRCSGTVAVRVKRAMRILSTRRVAIGEDCSFTSRLTLGRTRAKARAARGTLRFLVRFTGNPELLPTSAPEQRVRSG